MDVLCNKLSETPKFEQWTTFGLKIACEIYKAVGYVKGIDKFYKMLCQDFENYYTKGDDIFSLDCVVRSKDVYIQNTGERFEEIYIDIRGKAVTAGGDFYHFYVLGITDSLEEHTSVFDIFPDPVWQIELVRVG